MPASKLTACVCALALLSAAPKQTVAAAADLNSPAISLGGAPTNTAKADAAPEPRAADGPVEADSDAPQQARPRKKGNAFVRVITAPFRGLARLFGGGDKRPKVARVKVEVTPKPTPAPANAPAQTAAKPAPAAQDTQPAAQTVTPMTAPPLASRVPPPPTPAPTPVPAPAPLAPRSVIANETAAQQQQAAELFMPLIVGVPRDPLSQGRALLAQGYLNEAIAELSIAAVNSTNLVEANNLLGLAHDRRGWHRQAREYYERARSVAPNDPQVLNNLGYSLYLDDRYNDALDKLKQAARLAPQSAPVQNNLALVYGRLRKYDEAFKHFARAGGELYARLQTGALLDFAGRDREAIKHFEAARRLDPTSTEALRRLITLYNRTGQRDKAEAAQQELDRPKTKAVS
ncbi:MAG TPA: tetratricopeptide repeat protein [Pyrinomonadaceae bacterium]|nr:tetratricopeptide repeat protein [Pyrinomonadaceae bacterium]